jgi:IclR family acetate operon transcriptional repressor
MGAAPSYMGRLLDLLMLVGEQPGQTLGQLSRRSGVPLSTASRLVGLLVERGLARRDGSGNQVVVGPALERMALRSMRRWHDFGGFQERVDRLAERTGESVSLGVLTFDRIVLVARREAPQDLRLVVRVGDVVPPLRSAMGKVILAHLPPPRQDALLRATAADGDGPAAPGPELRVLRERGYADDDGGFAVGLRCVAVPFFATDGEPVGGISVAGPSARFTAARARAAVPAMLAEARAISEELGLAPANTGEDGQA